MNLKKITSLTMLLAMIVMSFSGIMLFIAPPGRVANWANWEILNFSKDLFAQIHTSFMVLFIVMTILHLFYNWKPITSYLKNRTKQMILFTNDMLVAIIITIIFLFGTINSISPFSTFLNFGDQIKNSWEKEYGTAPYSHAELSSLKMFCKKLGFDLEESKKILFSNNINFDESQSLSQIGNDNQISPQFIYNLLKTNLQKKSEKIIPLTGMGKKSISEVAQTLNLSSSDFIKKLKSIGIEAKSDDKFKEVSENYDMSPMDVITKLGYKKPE